MISIDRYKDTSKHRGYVDAAQRQRKLTNFGASSATGNFNQKALKAELLFSGLLVEHNLPLNVSRLPNSGQIPMWLHEDNTYANWSSCKANY